MYEWNEEEERVDFSHNPFSMPQGEMDALQNKDPLDILAWQYDIVCNGVELSSGAIWNHRPDIMVKAFVLAGYTRQDVEEHRRYVQSLPIWPTSAWWFGTRCRPNRHASGR